MSAIDLLLFAHLNDAKWFTDKFLCRIALQFSRGDKFVVALGGVGLACGHSLECKMEVTRIVAESDAAAIAEAIVAHLIVGALSEREAGVNL